MENRFDSILRHWWVYLHLGYGFSRVQAVSGSRHPRELLGESQNSHETQTKSGEIKIFGGKSGWRNAGTGAGCVLAKKLRSHEPPPFPPEEMRMVVGNKWRAFHIMRRTVDNIQTTHTCSNAGDKHRHFQHIKDEWRRVASTAVLPSACPVRGIPLSCGREPRHPWR